MKRNVAVTAGSALAAFFLTLAVFWPYGVDAVDPGESAKPLVKIPTLASHGCELSVSVVAVNYKAGESPACELKVRNTSAAAASFTATVTLSLTSFPDGMSRIGPMPRLAWKSECQVALAAGEEKTFPLATNIKLNAGQSGIFTLSVEGQSIAAAHFGVPMLLQQKAPAESVEKVMKWDLQTALGK